MRRPHLSPSTLFLALLAALASAGAPPAERLKQEEARLAKLQAELQRIRKGAPKPAGGAGEQKPKNAGEETPAPRPEALATRPSNLDTPSLLTRRPSVSAADVLYRVGRFKEARAVYEAALKRKELAKADRVWAGLQAGNCCRRLGDYDAAIEHFQRTIAADPDNPWCKGHVAWAQKTAQWEKRWARLELKDARDGAAVR